MSEAGAPPPYPRIPHLASGRGTRDDVVLDPADTAALLAGPVLVEEKLDGANVVLWGEGGVRCALRSGVTGQDRAGQLGPLRAWAAERSDALRALLADGSALYAEWLLITHTVAYEQLPAYLIGLDLRRPDGRFGPVPARDHALERAGIHQPPKLWSGTPGSIATIEGQLGASAWGPGPAEGVVVRGLGNAEPRLAKLLRPGFDRLDDRAWSTGRPRNRLADREASWR